MWNVFEACYLPSSHSYLISLDICTGEPSLFESLSSQRYSTGEVGNCLYKQSFTLTRVFLSLIAICNTLQWRECDGILISCSKQNKTKQNDGAVSTAGKLLIFFPRYYKKISSFIKTWVGWPYKAFSVEAKLVANRFYSSNIVCLFKGPVAHVILGRDEKEEEKGDIVYNGFD